MGWNWGPNENRGQMDVRNPAQDKTFADVPFEQELNFEPESEFDPLCFDNIGQFFDGYSGLEGIEICGFDNDGPSELPDWDFANIGNDIASWMDEPLNIPCQLVLQHRINWLLLLLLVLFIVLRRLNLKFLGTTICS